MKRTFWLGLLAGPALVATALAATALAQAPAPPPVPAAPGAIPAAPAAPRNIWSFFSRTPEQKAQCKDAFCKSGIGKMMSSAAAPMSAFTGGLTQDRCIQNAIDQALKNDPEGDTAEGAAAQIKKSEAGAKARRAAVRFLGTVDCSRFTQAIAVLKNSLLEDPNECVRYEAALALQSGCCCNPEIVKALTDCISGKSRVVEKSERVKEAAAVALSKCQIAEPVGPAIEELRKDEIQKKVHLTPQDYYKHVAELPPEQIRAEARQVLAEVQSKQQATAAVSGRTAPARPTSVAGILANAFTPASHSAPEAPVETAAQPSAEPANESKILNAVLTSQTKTPASSATPTSPAAPAGPVAHTERRPFFDGLTRALRGKQTSRTTTVPAEMPAPTAAPEGPAATAPETTPTPVTPASDSAPAAPQETSPAAAPQGTAPAGTSPTPLGEPVAPPATPSLPGLSEPLPPPPAPPAP